jgi:hypothetical protein
VVLALAFAAPARAQEAAARAPGVRLAQIRHDGNWQPRPGALKRLAWEIEKRTSIDIGIEPVALRVRDDALFDHPLVGVAGDRALPPMTGDEVARLRRHLTLGGLLLIDSAEARPGGGFDQSVRELAARLFPKHPLAPLPEDHVVYKSFFLLDGAPGRTRVARLAEAVEQDREIRILYVQNDLGGAWARDELGRWEHEVVPGGEHQRELAFRFGINVVMYALCLDYKADQVHVPFILHRRRWKADE